MCVSAAHAPHHCFSLLLRLDALPSKARMYSQSGQRFPDPAGVDGGFSLPGFPMTPRLQGQTLDGSFKASGKTVVITGGSQASCSHAIMRAYYMHGFAWVHSIT